MATNIEEIILRMGMDASAVAKTTASMMDRQKRAAMDYVDFWKGVMAKKDEAFVKSSTKEIEQIKRVEQAEKESLQRREAAMERYAANNTPERIAILSRRQAAINAEMAAGSGGLGWRKDALAKEQMRGSSTASAAGNAAFMASSGMDVKDVAKFAGAAALGAGVAKGVEHGLQAGVVRESLVLVREGIRGAYSRMASSAMLLAQYLGVFKGLGSAAVNFTRVLGLAAGAVGTVFDVYTIGKLAFEMRRTGKAFQQYGASESSGAVAAVGISSRLQNMIDDLQNKGGLTEEQASRLTVGNQGSYAANIATQRALRKAIAKYKSEHGDDASRIKTADADYEKAKSQMDSLKMKEREIDDINKDIVDRNEKIEFLKKNVSALDEKSVEFHEARYRLMALEVEQEKDIETSKKAQAEHEKQIAEWRKFSDSAARDFMRGKINKSQEEAQYVSIEDLAGRDWYSSFSRQYGKGGRYDLGSGEGPFAGVARNYERNKFYQMRDRQLGNMGQADIDRKNMISARDFLIKSGAASPEMLLGKIGDDTSALRELFNSLKRNGLLQVGLNDSK